MVKRHASLRDLSSDHHQGLVHARHLVKAAESPADHAALMETAKAFILFWGEHTNHHFREEEEVLLPEFARYGDPSAPPAVRMLVEHVRIRQLVGDLVSQVDAGAPSPETMGSLGTLLRDHIRHEEDVLFPLIESALPEQALLALPAAFAAFDR
ncbi:MAG: hemerythrin domain-containing protein [Chloroflexota bacterium]